LGWFIFVIAAGWAIFCFVSRPVQIASSGIERPPAVPVTACPVETRDVPVWLTGVGTVAPINVVTIKARVDGQLDKVLFVEGQEVAEHDMLAQIDPRPYQALLKQAEAIRLKDQVTLTNQKVDLERFIKLAKSGAATAQSVDTAAAQIAASEATIAADDAAVDTAKLQLDFTSIRAPIDGRAGLRLVDPGSIVHASDATGLVTITQMAPISVLFTMPQDDLPRIRDAMKDQSLKVDIYSRDGSVMIVEGDLTVVDTSVDPANGQIKMRATFRNKDRKLWPGTFVTTRLLLRTEHGKLAVPNRAVLRGQNGSYVYRLTPDGTVEARNVTTGPVSDDVTVIKSGLTGDDRIVLDGQARLSNGAGVKEVPAPSTGTLP
jgi:multidrug efflux system membrane fusion protein